MQGANGLPKPDPDVEFNQSGGDQDIDTAGTEADQHSAHSREQQRDKRN